MGEENKSASDLIREINDLVGDLTEDDGKLYQSHDLTDRLAYSAHANGKAEAATEVTSLTSRLAIAVEALEGLKRGHGALCGGANKTGDVHKFTAFGGTITERVLTESDCRCICGADTANAAIDRALQLVRGK